MADRSSAHELSLQTTPRPEPCFENFPCTVLETNFPMNELPMSSSRVLGVGTPNIQITQNMFWVMCSRVCAGLQTLPVLQALRPWIYGSRPRTGAAGRPAVMLCAVTLTCSLHALQDKRSMTFIYAAC